MYTLPIVAHHTGETLDARVYVTHGVNTDSASVLVFDADGDVVLSTEPTRYIGYCTAEVIGMALADLVTRRGVEYIDIDDAISRAGLECRCDDEGGE